MGSGDAARAFVRWVQVAGKPERRHWRGDEDAAGVRPSVPVPNRVTGKSPPGPKHAAATVAHGETVARTFYDFHLQAGTGPLVNPFPLARARRAHACLKYGLAFTASALTNKNGDSLTSFNRIFVFPDRDQQPPCIL